MSSQRSASHSKADSQSTSFRFRTIFEIVGIALVIYIVVGAPGLPPDFIANGLALLSSSASSSSSSDHVTSSYEGASHEDKHTTTGGSAGEKVKSIVYPSRNLTCPPHMWQTYVVSTSPTVLYLDGFLSDEEVKELVRLSDPHYTPSTLFSSHKETHNPDIRRSEKALLPRTTTVQCIEARALALQGWPKDTFIERLWTQRYNVSGHYALHYDWGTASPRARRVGSFMVYLSGGEGGGEGEKEKLEGGGTWFPRIEFPGAGRAEEERMWLTQGGNGGSAGRWCDFLQCKPKPASSEAGGNGERRAGKDDETREGVTFLPRRGSAVFWQNFDAAGRGYKETLHAGLPVTKGQKIGLNIWSWYQAGHRAPEGADAEDDDEAEAESIEHSAGPPVDAKREL